MDFTVFKQALPILVKGYAGVFAVTIAVIIVVKLLSSLTNKKK